MRNLCCAARERGRGSSSKSRVVAAAVNDCTVSSARQSLHFSHPKQGERREREIERQHLEKASETQFGKLRDVFPHSPALQPLEPGTTPKTVSLGLPGTTVTQRSILSPVPTLVCCHCNPLSPSPSPSCSRSLGKS